MGSTHSYDDQGQEDRIHHQYAGEAGTSKFHQLGSRRYRAWWKRIETRATAFWEVKIFFWEQNLHEQDCDTRPLQCLEFKTSSYSGSLIDLTIFWQQRPCLQLRNRRQAPCCPGLFPRVKTFDTWDSSCPTELGVSEHSHSHRWPQTWQHLNVRGDLQNKVKIACYLVAHASSHTFTFKLKRTSDPFSPKLKHEEEITIHSRHRLCADRTRGTAGDETRDQPLRSSRSIPHFAT